MTAWPKTNMNYTSIPEDAIRQAIDAEAVFTEFHKTRKKAQAYAPGMYWKQEHEGDQLVKTLPHKRQERLGRRSPETEKIYAAYISKKKEIEMREATLAAEMDKHRRLNKALRVGRVPNIVVGLLQELEHAGLSEHFTVVGTHALYAYETAAGVRILPAALATQDVDLLWDARKRVRFVAEMEKLQVSILDILRKVDRSFERKEGALETAVNDKGFEVDFLRRPNQEGDVHPFQLSNDENDLWVIQALRADVLTQSPKFERVVFAANGAMATMKTIDPQVFVEFKNWLATEAPSRDTLKRRRDAQQASIVQNLIEEGLLIPAKR